MDEFNINGIDDFDTLILKSQLILNNENKKQLHKKQLNDIIHIFYKNIQNYNFNNIHIIKYIVIYTSISEFIISHVEYNIIKYIFRNLIDINCSEIIMSYLSVNIFDIIKLDDNLIDEFDDILFNMMYDFIGINYNLKNTLYICMPYNILDNINNINSIDELYEIVKYHSLFQTDIQNNIEQNDEIYEEIEKDVHTNFVVTGLGDIEYYTSNYSYHIQKYLKFNKNDLIKSKEHLDKFIEFCKIIKKNYYFTEEIKSYFDPSDTVYSFMHYIKFRNEQASIIQNLILS